MPAQQQTQYEIGGAEDAFNLRMDETNDGARLQREQEQHERDQREIRENQKRQLELI